MPRITTLSQLNEILGLFIVGRPLEPTAGAMRILASGDGTLSLCGDNVRKFDDSVEKLMASLPKLKGTLSQKLFLDQLIPLIRQKKLANEEFTTDAADQFTKTICDFPLIRFRVIRRILGVTAPMEAAPISMGDFVIGRGKQLFDSETAGTILALTISPADLASLYIQCTVEARDADRAREIADSLFYRFELLFRVLIGGRTTQFEVGVLNYVGKRRRDAILIALDGSLTQNLSWEGAHDELPLNHPYFASPAHPFGRLFELVTTDNNEVEKHIMRCAEWTGQSLLDPNAASAFVKGAIALEVMFSTNEKGPITPSIMAQISESCAFLLGDERKPPYEIEREVKKLYGIRSAIVHSGKDSVHEADLNSLVEICRDVVGVMLSSEEMAGVDTMAKLTEYFRRKKYS